MTSRIRKSALVEYSNDVLQNWQPPNTGRKRNEDQIDAYERLRDAASDLERVVSRGQWNRFSKAYDWFLYEISAVKSRFNPIYSALLAAWQGVFLECTIKKNNNEEYDYLIQWFGNVLEAFKITNQISLLNWSHIPNSDNFLLPAMFFSRPFSSHLTYKNYHNIAVLMRDAFNGLDEATKIQWINVASDNNYPSSPANELFYKFACIYSGDLLSDKAFEHLANNANPLQDTTFDIVKRIRSAQIDSEIKNNYFRKVRGLVAAVGKLNNLIHSLDVYLRDRGGLHRGPSRRTSERSEHTTIDLAESTQYRFLGALHSGV